jgi:hypothetical protein
LGHGEREIKKSLATSAPEADFYYRPGSAVMSLSSYFDRNFLIFLILELESTMGGFHHQSNKASRLSKVSWESPGVMQISLPLSNVTSKSFTMEAPPSRGGDGIA